MMRPVGRIVSSCIHRLACGRATTGCMKGQCAFFMHKCGVCDDLRRKRFRPHRNLARRRGGAEGLAGIRIVGHRAFRNGLSPLHAVRPLPVASVALRLPGLFALAGNRYRVVPCRSPGLPASGVGDVRVGRLRRVRCRHSLRAGHGRNAFATIPAQFGSRRGANMI